MTEPHPAPQPFAQQPYQPAPQPQPEPWVPNPAQPAWQSGAQPAWQHGDATARVLAAPGDPYAGGPGSEQPYVPYVPPVRAAEPPTPKRPKLTKEAAHRARLAGGIGGGITWLGLGITQLSVILLALPVLLSTIIGGIGFAGTTDGTSVTAGVWERTLEWLGSPWGITLFIGIPAGILLALTGLWVSTRMLRRGAGPYPGIRRPVGITWAGFGLSVAAATLLSGLGSVTLPFFGGIPFGDWNDGGRGFDPGFDPGFGPGDPGTDLSEGELREWLAGPGGDMLQQIADPGALLGFFGPWIAVAQLLALILPVALGIFTWWWMAHAMRPAAPAEVTEEAAE